MLYKHFKKTMLKFIQKKKEIKIRDKERKDKLKNKDQQEKKDHQDKKNYHLKEKFLKKKHLKKKGKKDHEQKEDHQKKKKRHLKKKLLKKKLKEQKKLKEKPKRVKREVSFHEAHDYGVRKMQKMAETGEYTQQQATHLMNATYIMRRFYIYHNRPPLDSLLKTYPLLFNLIEIKNEIGRILLDPEKTDIFLANVKTYAPLILNTLSKNDPLYISIQNIIASCAPENKEYANIAGGVLALPEILNEKRHFLHLKNERFQKSEFPYIEAGNYELKDILEKKARFEIRIEDYSLCETCDLPEALLCLISAHLSFLYSYKNANYNTYLMISYLFLEHEDIESGNTPPQIVKNYLDMWRRHTNGLL